MATIVGGTQLASHAGKKSVCVCIPSVTVSESAPTKSLLHEERYTVNTHNKQLANSVKAISCELKVS